MTENDTTERPSVEPIGYNEAGYGVRKEDGSGKFLLSAFELASGSVDGQPTNVEFAGDYIKIIIGDETVLFEIEGLVEAAAVFLEEN